MRKFLSATLLFLTISLTSFAQAPVKSIPNFTFYRFDRSQFTRANVTPGRQSVFVFFDVTCDHCQNTMKLMSQKAANLKNAGVYLVSLDREDAINAFMTRFGQGLLGQKNVVLLQDLRYQFIPAFMPDKYPSVFLFGADKKRLFYSSEEKEIPRLFAILK